MTVILWNGLQLPQPLRRDPPLRRRARSRRPSHLIRESAPISASATIPLLSRLRCERRLNRTSLALLTTRIFFWQHSRKAGSLPQARSIAVFQSVVTEGGVGHAR